MSAARTSTSSSRSTPSRWSGKPSSGATCVGSPAARVPTRLSQLLGRDVAMIGRLGDDEGVPCSDQPLEGDGVDTRHLLTTADVPNGVALISVGADGDNAIVVSPGANGRVALADIEAASAVLDTAAVTLLQLEVPLDAVAAAAARAGGTVILNPAPAPPEPSRCRCSPTSTCSCPTRRNSPPSPATTALSTEPLPPNCNPSAELVGDRHTRRRGCPRGARRRGDPCASLPLCARSTPRQQVIRSAARSPTAWCGLDLVEATRWAVRVGAATTQRPGAQPSLPTPDEVRLLIGD